MATFHNNSGVKINKGNLNAVREGIDLLANIEVLVGFPEDTTAREKDPTDPPEKQGITNAALGYIHDQGMPEQNIPQREFMRPAIEGHKDVIERALSGAMKVAMRGQDAVVLEQALHVLGLSVKLAIQRKINEGIEPPLSDRTLLARARRGKGSSIAKAAKLELGRRAKGFAPMTVLAKPLIDTAQMPNAVNYVIRSRRLRGR